MRTGKITSTQIANITGIKQSIVKRDIYRYLTFTNELHLEKRENFNTFMEAENAIHEIEITFLYAIYVAHFSKWPIDAITKLTHYVHN